MKSSTKKSLYKIFVSLFVVFYTFLPQSIVIGQVIDEVSQENAAPIEEEIIPEESLPQEEVVLPEEEIPPVVEEPLVEDIPIEEPIIQNPLIEKLVVEKPVVEQENIIKEVLPIPVWVINGDSATTYDVVELGKTYISPQNSKVRVIFTKLPENPSKLTITEITLTQEEIDATNAVSNIAYDITTDMIDGTFEYDLTLPNTKENTKVVYVEEREDLLTGVEEITNEIVDEGDTIKIEDLEHLTLFIPVNGGEMRVSGSLDGQTQVTVNPGQSIRVDLEVEGQAGDVWKSSSWQIEGESLHCVNHEDYNVSSTTASESFDITAPSSNGTYDVNFIVYTDDTCSSGDSNTLTLTNGIIVGDTYVIPGVSYTYDVNDPVAFKSVTGVWTSVNGGRYITGVNTNEVRWGKSTGFGKSGLRFDGSGLQSFNTGDTFYLGALTHFNFPITDAADGATLKITLEFEKPGVSPNPEFSFYFHINETTNTFGLRDCPSFQESKTPCDDKITFPSIDETTSFKIGDKLYTLKIEGFVGSYPDGSPVPDFITEEYRANTAFLVGSLSSVLIEEPGISIIKKTNNIDVEEALGPELYVGDTVTWQYIVQNIGNVKLTNINVTDNIEGSAICPKAILQPGEDMTCEITDGVVAVGQYENTATVVGTPPTGSNVTASDSSWYYGIWKKGHIIVDKVTNPSGDSTSFNFTTTGTDYVGFTLTDTTPPNNQELLFGDYSVSEETVTGWHSASSCTSSIGDTESADDLELDPGETITCIFTNSKLSIDVVKTANPTSVPETGGDVEYTVRVNNPSAVSVNLTSLSDDKFGDVTTIEGSTCMVPQTITSGSYYECKFTKNNLTGNAGTNHINTVTATASEVTDTDEATVDFSDVAPEIKVTKTASPTSVPETGGDVTFTFLVENIGDEDVTLTSLSDSVFGDLNGQGDCVTGGLILIDGEYECSVTKTLSADDLAAHYNVTTAVGTDDDGTTDEATDDETVTFNDVAPEIKVTKTASPTSVPETGGDVTFTFLVENIGDEDVTLTSLSDSVFGDLNGQGDCVTGGLILIDGEYECSVTKTLSADDLAAHYNVTTAVGTDDDGTTDEATDDETVTFNDVAPEIKVEKTAGSLVLPVPGGNVEFTIVVTNNSQELVTLTDLTDDIYGDLNGQGTCATGGIISANGGIYTCTFTGAVNGNPGFYTDVVTAIATDNDGTTDTDTDDATVELEGGKIIVEKLTTIPDPSHQLFEFKPSWGNNFSLINDQSIDSGWLAPGSYSVEELTTSGWELTSTNCISSIGDTEIPGSLELDANETITCTFTNTRDTGSLTVYKVIDEDGDLATTDDQTIGIDWEFDVDGAEGDTSNPSPLLTDTEGKRIFPDLKTGNYNVIETYVAGFEIVGATCGIENGSLDGNIMYSVEVSKNINTICTFYNTPNGVVQGYKWNDINKDGIKDSDEPLLPGWTINLYKSNEIGFGETLIDSTQTGNTEDNFGMYSFDHLLPATYKVCEEQKDGWNQSYPINDKNNCYIVTLPSESEPLSLVLDVDEYYFGNYVIPPQLRITKDNNSPVEGLLTGSTVLYTIIVTAPSDEDEKGTYLINNIKVTDILPKGFEYMPGTWTANSSVRGNIKGSITTEPEYNEGLATWILGDMKEGEIVTLTYTAKINLLNEPGTYKDIAFVQGDSLLAEKDSGDVLGISYDPSEYLHTDTLGDNFVGTNVLVVEPIEEGGEVLGASTTLTLPKTGAETYITLGAIISMILGILLLVFGKKRKLNTILLSTVLLFGIFTLVKPIQTYAQVSGTKVSVRLEQPKTGLTDREFNVTYVALSIPVKPITVQCQYSLDGVNFSNFDTLKTTNSGDCKVDQSIVTGSGTYYFKAVATVEGVAPVESEVVSVNITDNPSPVTEYSKTKTACIYTLKFKSPTSKVQIFRSDNQKSFYADDTTLITKPYLTVTPNVLSTYTDTPADCSKEYYYAVRAVDEYSNVSTLVTDNVVTVVEQTQTSTSQESEEVAGEETTTQQEQETTSTGEVAGEETTAQQEEKAETDTKDETKTEEKETEESIWDKYKYLIISVIVVALGSGIYDYIRRKK